MEEIQKFQKVVELIPTLGRDSSLRKQFGSQYRLEIMKHSELLTEIIKQVEEKLKTREESFQILTQQVQRLERQYQALEQRLIQLKETLSTQEQTSSGWFRRKR
ncbi:hypothetical protein P0E52_09835 [Enterococcus faecalis]|uniref:hypothetical protein n=1 Tax=Enterococcus TaxID=1350 RepID=UPI0025B26429|nr:hypothetical protein [Enterococcus faecalis]MDN3114292.1 hypothetical protein [Enterococcus faecalis]